MAQSLRSSPLVNVCDHIVQFRDRRIILRFATKYEIISANDQEIVLGHKINLIPMIEDKTIVNKDSETIITFNKLPLFMNTTIKMYKLLIQILFNKFSINFRLDFQHNNFQFVNILQECDNIDAYDHNTVIGNYSIILTCNVNYDLDFNFTPRVTTGIEHFYYDMMSLDYNVINPKQKYESEKMKIIVGHYPKNRIKINLTELYLMIKSKLLNSIDNVSITHPTLNAFNNLKKGTSIISSRFSKVKITKGEADSVVITYDEPTIYSMTIFIDGTIITCHKTDEYAEEHALAATRKINELNLNEFEVNNRYNDGYTHTEAAFNIRYNVDFNLNDNPIFGSDKYITTDKITSKRFYYYASSFITEYKLYNVFRALISDVPVNRIIFARRQKTNISIWNEGGQHYIQFNNISNEEEAMFIIHYLSLINQRKTFLSKATTKQETYVNGDLKTLQTLDPNVFGKITVNGKQTTYSKLVSHGYERPVLISEDDYYAALQLDPKSVVKMINQSVEGDDENKFYYIQCQDKDHDKMYFHVVDGKCFPKCTKVVRNIGQFNQCLEKLGISDSKPLQRVRNRILKYSPNIEIGSKCELTKTLARLFPSCYFLRFALDEDTSVEKYIINTFNQKCLVLTETDEGIKIYKNVVDDKDDLDKIIVFIPNYVLRRRENTEERELVYYLLCKQTRTKEIVPQLVTEEFNKIVESVGNNDLKQLECYNLDLEAEELIPIGIGQHKIGYYSQETNEVFLTRLRRDLNLTQLSVFPTATLPTLESIKNPKFISYDRQACFTTDGKKIPIQDEEENLKKYRKKLYDTKANFMNNIYQKKISVEFENSPYKINYTKVFLQRLLFKGCRTLEDLKNAGKIADETKIVLICDHIPSVLESKISEKDYNDLINQVDVYEYIYRIYRLDEQLGEFMTIY